MALLCVDETREILLATMDEQTHKNEMITATFLGKEIRAFISVSAHNGFSAFL